MLKILQNEKWHCFENVITTYPWNCLLEILLRCWQCIWWMGHWHQFTTIEAVTTWFSHKCTWSIIAVICPDCYWTRQTALDLDKIFPWMSNNKKELLLLQLFSKMAVILFKIIQWPLKLFITFVPIIGTSKHFWLLQCIWLQTRVTYPWTITICSH